MAENKEGIFSKDRNKSIAWGLVIFIVAALITESLWAGVVGGAIAGGGSYLYYRNKKKHKAKAATA